MMSKYPSSSPGVPPGKLTCPLKINGWKMYFLLKQSFFRGHVSFLGCTSFGISHHPPPPPQKKKNTPLKTLVLVLGDLFTFYHGNHGHVSPPIGRKILRFLLNHLKCKPKKVIWKTKGLVYSTHRIRVWFIYQHLVDFCGKCR